MFGCDDTNLPRSGWSARIAPQQVSMFFAIGAVFSRKEPVVTIVLRPKKL